MSIQESLSNYHNSLYFRLAIDGDVDRFVNMGTDFARSKMMEYNEN